MPNTTLSFKETGYFSSVICDYLEQKKTIRPFYNRYPSISGFKAQMEEKGESFSSINRKVLVQQLKEQYAQIDNAEPVLDNVNLLAQENTFTITTGHQLNLFTGPLYFLYKIAHTIVLSRELKNEYPTSNFVPVYWMATEDHDFDEINYFTLKGKKIKWNREASGPVGKLDTKGLNEVLDYLKENLDSSIQSQQLVELFEMAYVKGHTLAHATRIIAHKLFGKFGLVIIDGDDQELKKLFIPYAKKDLFENTSFKSVSERSKQLVKEGYPEQVHPREINLFYIEEGVRERIIALDDGRFAVNNTKIVLSGLEMEELVDNYPEKISPNALLRPLYQEVILPNLCYIGGGGELAYWFQLKSYFEKVDVPFPMLLLRNSALLMSNKQDEKRTKLGLTMLDLFEKQTKLLASVTKSISDIKIDFSEQKKILQNQFKALYEIAKNTDASFLGAVAAQEKKQCNGLDNLEKRLLKAQKRKYSDILERVTQLQNELFPNGSLQERQENFASFYNEDGEALILKLLDTLEPIPEGFKIIVS